MGVRSGQSRVVDHSFRVYQCVIHPEWLSVRSHSRFAKTGWEADVRIIDGGHAVTWGSGDDRLTEVIVGPDADLPDSGQLFRSPIRREHSTRLRPAPRVNYQSCFEVERLDAEVFAHLSEELAHESCRHDLFHQFGSHQRFGLTPISRLHVETRGKGISVAAFHTFPSEQTIVRVQSLFEVVA